MVERVVAKEVGMAVGREEATGAARVVVKVAAMGEATVEAAAVERAYAPHIRANTLNGTRVHVLAPSLRRIQSIRRQDVRPPRSQHFRRRRWRVGGGPMEYDG